MAMVPHERSLVQRFEGKPFALLGVNLDRTLEEFQEVQQGHKINWRSWHDKGSAIAGPWGVQGIPTLYLIDHRGIIRKKWEGGPPDAELDRAVEDLVAEAVKG